jgi:hypothetical protein
MMSAAVRKVKIGLYRDSPVRRPGMALFIFDQKFSTMIQTPRDPLQNTPD